MYATQGQINKDILQVEIEMRGTINPQVINNFKFFDKGTLHITNAKLYYTTTPTFNTNNLLASIATTTAGIYDFNITPLTVGHGKHYF